ISIKGSGLSGNIQFIFCIFMAAVVATLFVRSFFVGEFSFGNAQPLFNNESGIWTSNILIVAIAPWMYVGFDNIPQAAEEFKFSADKTFRLIVFGILASIITYVLMILVTSWIYPDQGQIGGALWVTASVVQTSMGGLGMALLALAISFRIFTGLNGVYMSSSRLLSALGPAHSVPACFASLHHRKRPPSLAVCVVVLACLSAPWRGRTGLSWSVDLSSTGVSVAFHVTSFVAVQFFSSRERYHLLYVVLAWP